MKTNIFVFLKLSSLMWRARRQQHVIIFIIVLEKPLMFKIQDATKRRINRKYYQVLLIWHGIDTTSIGTFTIG